jgi:AcrR family transcriptional regulator
LASTAVTDRRTQLIEAAQRVIARRGLAASTTREIASEAGVAEGTIYRYFEDKIDLCLAVVSRRLPEILRRLPEQAGRRSPRAILVDVVTEAIEAYDELAPFLSGVVADPELAEKFRERARGDDDARKAYRGLSAYLTAEQKAGRIGGDADARLLARMLLATAFHHAYMSLAIGEEQLELRGKRLAEMLVESVLRAAGPAKAKTE